jgi:hypothetical protein
MAPDKSREHRLRVLENQARIAAERAAAARGGDDQQMTMPLIVEVKNGPERLRRRRPRKKSKTEQPHLGNL